MYRCADAPEKRIGMYIDEIYRVEAPYREAMVVKGYRFGKGSPVVLVSQALFVSLQ